MSSHQYAMLTNLVKLCDRPKFPRKTRGFCIGIGGKDSNSDDIGIRQRQLFTAIVSNTATTSEKRLMVSSMFISMKTRGKAVSIGPLEYCGNGVPLKNTNGSIL
jgi:hypothetical protein